MGKQGHTYNPRPPQTCACGRRFTPSIVVEHGGGTGNRYKCPPCTAAEKETKRKAKKQD